MIKTGLLAGAGLVVFGWLIFNKPWKQNDPIVFPTNYIQSNANVEDIEFLDVKTGSRKKLHNLKNKVILLHFWATWCPACLNEMGELDDLAAKNPDIEIIALSGDDVLAIKEFYSQNDIKNIGIFQDNGISQKFNVNSLPTTIVIKNGKKYGRASGPIAWLSKLGKNIIEASQSS